MSEYFETSPKKGRGRAKRSLVLIDAMFEIAKAAQPITGRGVGYKLFVQKLIQSMSRQDMNAVYRLLKEAREEGTIPWSWIVDETRELEKVAMWDNPAAFVRTMGNSYRREFWNWQPVVSKCGARKAPSAESFAPRSTNTVWASAYSTGSVVRRPSWKFAGHDDRRPLIVLYVGDLDPSGVCMSEADLPKRFREYGGDHVVHQAGRHHSSR